MNPTNHNRRRAPDYAFLGLGICLLVTVPVCYAVAAALALLIDWVLG